jgi:hypothetical protein
MVLGLIHEGSVNLTGWIMTVQSKAKYAQSTQRRFQRWLNNPRLNVMKLYTPIIQYVLSDWQDEIIYLSLDTSMLWNEYCLVRVSILHRGRALPLGWRVIEHGSSSISFTEYQNLLARIARLLPRGKKIILLADRGFVHIEMMKYIREKLSWHYRIRVKSNFSLKKARKQWSQVNNYHLNLGQAILLQNVTRQKTNPLQGVYLALGRENMNGELWYIVSSEPTTLQTFFEYGLRFQIEENFLDDKSNGFELESSMIRSAPALSRLCFVIAIATLFLTLQGVAVVESGKRRWVDPHWNRGDSYLKIGWKWIKSALSKGWKLFSVSKLITNHDREPVISSKKQYLQKNYRLEFQVYSYDYAS